MWKICENDEIFISDWTNWTGCSEKKNKTRKRNGYFQIEKRKKVGKIQWGTKYKSASKRTFRLEFLSDLIAYFWREISCRKCEQHFDDENQVRNHRFTFTACFITHVNYYFKCCFFFYWYMPIKWTNEYTHAPINKDSRMKMNKNEYEQSTFETQRFQWNLFMNTRNWEIDAIDAKSNTLLFINTHDLFVVVFSGHILFVAVKAVWSIQLKFHPCWAKQKKNVKEKNEVVPWHAMKMKHT